MADPFRSAAVPQCMNYAAVEQYMSYVEQKENPVEGSTPLSKMRLVVFQDTAGKNKITCWEWDKRNIFDRIGALIGTLVAKFIGVYLGGYCCDLKLVAKTAAEQNLFNPGFATELSRYNTSHNNRIEAKIIRAIAFDTTGYIEEHKQQILAIVNVFENTLSVSAKELGFTISRQREDAVIQFKGDPDDLQNLKKNLLEKACAHWSAKSSWDNSYNEKEALFGSLWASALFTVKDLAKVVEFSEEVSRKEDMTVELVRRYKTPSIEAVGDREKLKAILGDQFDSFCTAFEESLRPITNDVI